jgi:hypothetical protein
MRRRVHTRKEQGAVKESRIRIQAVFLKRLHVVLVPDRCRCITLVFRLFTLDIASEPLVLVQRRLLASLPDHCQNLSYRSEVSIQANPEPTTFCSLSVQHLDTSPSTQGAPLQPSTTTSSQIKPHHTMAPTHHLLKRASDMGYDIPPTVIVLLIMFASLCVVCLGYATHKLLGFSTDGNGFKHITVEQMEYMAEVRVRNMASLQYEGRKAWAEGDGQGRKGREREVVYSDAGDSVMGGG